MCYDRRRAEACVDESAHHALTNAGVGRLWERRRGNRRGVREGACIGGATMLQPWTLRLIRNATQHTPATSAYQICQQAIIQGRRGPSGPSEHSYRPKQYQNCNLRGHTQIL